VYAPGMAEKTVPDPPAPSPAPAPTAPVGDVPDGATARNNKPPVYVLDFGTGAGVAVTVEQRDTLWPDIPLWKES
jgi:hypothetical protein